MKKIKTIILFLSFALFGIGIFSFAQDYIFFYGNGCFHCDKVESFFKQNKVTEKFDIAFKEIYFNRKNLTDLNFYLDKLKISSDKIGVPFLVINSGVDCSYLNGDQAIIDYFKNKLSQNLSGTCKDTLLTGTNLVNQSSNIGKRLSFFGIMLPAAISDSINPCAFAVMLLLLSTILSKHKSRRKTILSGILFCLAVFLTYLAMGIGLFSALATTTNTLYLKLVVGILGILVGLANVKDYFRYGKFFVMEVPFSRRPKMMSIIEKVSSPLGTFLVGILVSLFLLPCSSGPYFTILGYLSAQTKELHLRGYIYLVVYNLIFTLPMVIITFLVGLGFRSVDQLAKIKHDNTRLIHLIVGILMLGLGIYVLTTI
ncbi:MAG: cytochrome c biogenesis CcdA family protein [Candidatus Absconditabacterales bacterium]